MRGKGPYRKPVDVQLARAMAGLYRKLAEAQTPTEPDISEVIAKNRARLYAEFPLKQLAGE